ncbi:MAG TPA: hypothetical protein VEW48_12220, partial [Thermoanaerobaculia bacterium]|nr:hypothetical protein [Thermoanaerobaculia bacterium]
CSGDDGLRREVESLLAARREAGDFLSDPASLVEDEPPADSTGCLRGDGMLSERLVAGTRLGPYEEMSLLLKQVGFPDTSK